MGSLTTMCEYSHDERVKRFSPDVDQNHVAERFHQGCDQMKSFDYLKHNQEDAFAIISEYYISCRLYNKWWLAMDIAENNEVYIILRRRIPHDVVRMIWTEFIVTFPVRNCRIK